MAERLSSCLDFPFLFDYSIPLFVLTSRMTAGQAPSGAKKSRPKRCGSVPKGQLFPMPFWSLDHFRPWKIDEQVAACYMWTTAQRLRLWGSQFNCRRFY